MSQTDLVKIWFAYHWYISGYLVATSFGNELLEDNDIIRSSKKRVERNSHDHHHGHDHDHGHGHAHGHGEGVDLLDFFQQVGVRLTDGKDREGADDLGNGKKSY